MPSVPTIIGKGTYGCVHKPSLKCKKSNIKYDNKISKVMNQEDALKELEEYREIKKIDPNQRFYLGEPHNCLPDNTTENIQAISNCKMKKNKKFEDLSLLIMNDGGMNLETFGKSVYNLENTIENREKIESFWLEMHNIFIGVKLFLDNNLIHHDLKAGNIVYNPKNNKLYFIDFGLMKNRVTLKELSKQNKNNMAVSHWSFPFEIINLNKYSFDILVNMTDQEKIDSVNYLIDGLERNDEKMEIVSILKIFFNEIISINDKNIDEDEYRLVLTEYMTDYYNYIKDVNNHSYEEIVNRCLNTIDVYGLGLACRRVFLYTKHFLDTNTRENLESLINQMITANLFERYNIETCINIYEKEVLSSILKKREKQFINNKLVIKNNIPNKLLKTISKIDKNDFILSPKEKTLEDADFVILKNTTKNNKYSSSIFNFLKKQKSTYKKKHVKGGSSKNKKTRKTRKCG